MVATKQNLSGKTRRERESEGELGREKNARAKLLTQLDQYCRAKIISIILSEFCVSVYVCVGVCGCVCLWHSLPLPYHASFVPSE